MFVILNYVDVCWFVLQLEIICKFVIYVVVDDKWQGNFFCRGINGYRCIVENDFCKNFFIFYLNRKQFRQEFIEKNFQKL